jgi:catechol 2,3-dioxygenase-like lactoylglutathione lyase family enzyme
MAPIARFSLVALDCPDPLALARFYAAITGWEVEDDDGDWDGNEDWVQLHAPDGATIAFQRVPDHQPPHWPSSDHPQQLHIDFDVPDLDDGERAVLVLGARKADVQPGTSFRVFLDPAGHPFCLVLDPDVELA